MAEQLMVLAPGGDGDVHPFSSRKDVPVYGYTYLRSDADDADGDEGEKLWVSRWFDRRSAEGVKRRAWHPV